MRRLTLFFATLLLALPVFAADPTPVGVWRTIDDKTHRPRGLIRLYEQDGQIFGKIENSFDPKELQEVCDKCADDRRNKPILGLVVLRGMKKSGSDYAGGDILDPDTGSVYRCKMTVTEDGKKLVVRGFLGVALLGRSQTWYRHEF